MTRFTIHLVFSEGVSTEYSHMNEPAFQQDVYSAPL